MARVYDATEECRPGSRDRWQYIAAQRSPFYEGRGMPRYDACSIVSEVNGFLSGERRAPSNSEPWRTGNSMHNEAWAMRAGFRGALVPGVRHIEQLVPLALHAFGPAWFERGGYSIYFRTPTCHEETVQAFMHKPAATEHAQVGVWSEAADGAHVLDGSLEIGSPSEPGHLRQRMIESAGRGGDLRILADHFIGQEFDQEVRCFPLELGPAIKGVAPRPGGEGQLLFRDDTTEPLDWYFGASPWGGPVAGPQALHRLLKSTASDGGLIGGIEVRMINGPAFVDRDYVLSTRVAGIDVSPRTENLWCETQLHDESRQLVADMLLMTRFVKQTSPLYAEEATETKS